MNFLVGGGVPLGGLGAREKERLHYSGLNIYDITVCEVRISQLNESDVSS